MQSVAIDKENIYEERGSFTIEATLICVFIIVIVFNLLIFILQGFDLCMLHEDISRNIIKINDAYEMNYLKNNNNRKILDVIEDIEQENNYGVQSLRSIDLVKLNYYVVNNEIRVDVVYRYKKNYQTIINKICGVNNKYNFTRVYKLVCFD